MIGESATTTQLCPYCANSIAADAAKCSYCSADLLSGTAPKWLNRNQSSSEPRPDVTTNKKFPIPPKFIWAAGILAVVLAAFFAGGYLQRRELSQLSQANLKQLQAKDEMIQSQQTQLAQVQQQLTENASQLGAMKTKLEENQKALTATHQRQAAASRDVARSSMSRSTGVARTASHAPATLPPPAQPVAAGRTAQPGVYETTQATTVYDNPSPSARAISQIGRGTRINVVGSSGDWLEVHSNRGNPPGFVRSDAARPIVRAN